MQGELVTTKNETQTMLLARAELDTQISTAKAYPRNVETFVKRAEYLATMNQEIAASCMYGLPRKDADGTQKLIEGPSIRLAEIVCSVWGNIHCGSRVISNDGKSVIVEAVAWDLESNVKVSKQVSRSITSKKGFPFSADMQVVTTNAAQSIALRNAILGVVPQALVEQVYSSAKKVAVGDEASLAKNREIMINSFVRGGIPASKIFAYLEIGSIEELTLEHLEQLLCIRTALKEKQLQKESVFDIQDDSVVGLTTTEKLQRMLDAKQAQPEPAKAA